jgi:hypothetical protein
MSPGPQSAPGPSPLNEVYLTYTIDYDDKQNTGESCKPERLFSRTLTKTVIRSVAHYKQPS